MQSFEIINNEAFDFYNNNRKAKILSVIIKTDQNFKGWIINENKQENYKNKSINFKLITKPYTVPSEECAKEAKILKYKLVILLYFENYKGKKHVNKKFFLLYNLIKYIIIFKNKIQIMTHILNNLLIVYIIVLMSLSKSNKILNFKFCELKVKLLGVNYKGLADSDTTSSFTFSKGNKSSLFILKKKCGTLLWLRKGKPNLKENINTYSYLEEDENVRGYFLNGIIFISNILFINKIIIWWCSLILKSAFKINNISSNTKIYILLKTQQLFYVIIGNT